MLVSAPTTLELPPGVHEAIDIPEGVKGLVVRGAGRVGPNATIIKGLRAAGLWYSRFENVCFAPPTATDCVVDIDGTVFGVQANTFIDCLFSGRGLYDGQPSEVAFYLNRTSTNSGQGSENIFINCHFSGARTCYVQHGYNALNNTFIGGNFQDYVNGIVAIAGSFNVLSTGFQSTRLNEQLDGGDSDGWDIRADSGGVNDQIFIKGCRTESVKFYKGGAPQSVTIEGCWQGVDTNLLDHNRYEVRNGVIYGCTSDTWKPYPYSLVDIHNGTINSCTWQLGSISQYHDNKDRVMEVDRSCEIPSIYSCVLASAANESIVLNLPSPASVPIGHKLEVVRADSHPRNTVTIRSDYLNNNERHSVKLKTGGLTFRALGGHVAPRRWYLLDQPNSMRFVD